MEFVKSKKGTVLTVLSGAATAVLCLVMNLITLPHIEEMTQGIRCFDMNFGYDYATAQRFISLLDEAHKSYYLHVQLPLDFLYPAVYTLFFILLLAKLTGKLLPFCMLPLLLAVFDVTENICTILMLKASVLSQKTVSFASAATMAKTLLMYAVFAVIIICLVLWIVKRRKA